MDAASGWQRCLGEGSLRRRGGVARSRL